MKLEYAKSAQSTVRSAITALTVAYVQENLTTTTVIVLFCARVVITLSKILVRIAIQLVSTAWGLIQTNVLTANLTNSYMAANVSVNVLHKPTHQKVPASTVISPAKPAQGNLIKIVFLVTSQKFYSSIV